MANTSNRGDQTGQVREDTGASGLAQKSQDTTANVGDKARNLASNVSQRASELTERAGDKADETLSSMGQRMSSMAGSLRQSAPREGVVGSAAGAVADQLESGGRYLQEHGLSDIGDDVANVVRRNPFPALCVAFGVGFLIGMVARR
jgi:ElaB/YqjD/DUF883 family membrane-anchored ribosome-binding protein